MINLYGKTDQEGNAYIEVRNDSDVVLGRFDKEERYGYVFVPGKVDFITNFEHNKINCLLNDINKNEKTNYEIKGFNGERRKIRWNALEKCFEYEGLE
jgi:hypothetical protein